MEDNDWKVTVVESIASMTIEMFVYRNAYDGKRELLTKGGTESVVVSKGETVNNDLYFAQFPNYFVASLAIEAFEKKGISPPSKDFNTGKLEATEKHLEDMRRLAFSTNEPITTHMQLKENK